MRKFTKLFRAFGYHKICIPFQPFQYSRSHEFLAPDLFAHRVSFVGIAQLEKVENEPGRGSFFHSNINLQTRFASYASNSYYTNMQMDILRRAKDYDYRVANM